MLGVDNFSSVFGGSPAHTGAHYVEHLRAVIRAGYSPVLCRPGTAETACILTPVQFKRTGPHPCGSNHVLDDPLKVGAVVKHWLDKYAGLNVGLHLGRSSLAVITSPAAPGMTVEAPGGIGHWWFTLPGPAVDSQSTGGWEFLSGDRYVLVPPARQPQGPYRLVGGTIPAPGWMLDG